jgi:hypothetical protein
MRKNLVLLFTVVFIGLSLKLQDNSIKRKKTIPNGDFYNTNKNLTSHNTFQLKQSLEQANKNKFFKFYI